MSDQYVGEIRLFAFGRVPTGWLACNGQQVSISSYTALYTLIGTTFGGDGVNTFNLPDLRGRVPLAAGTGPSQPTYVIGQVAGEEMHTLRDQEMPSHSHALISTTNAGTTAMPGTTVHIAKSPIGRNIYNAPANAAPYDIMAPCVTPAGNNVAHDNSMPSIACNFCIAFDGIYPTPS
jgi:microcystin-dependent protein